MSRFLTFVVEEALAGSSGRIKEYVIALEVFDKHDDYDPHSDSTVRTEASKLRAKLNRYYNAEGQGDRVVISIPKGSYVPVFGARANEVTLAHAQDSRRVEAVALVGPAAAGPPARIPRRGWWVWICAGLALVASAAAVVGFIAKRNVPQTTYLPAVPLTSYPGFELQPSFSPDGNQVAFVWNGPKQDNFDIYVKLIGSGDPMRLTKDPAIDLSPAWSPDGRMIAFIRQQAGGVLDVMLIPALGTGEERKLAGIISPIVSDVSLDPKMISRVLAWSPDSKWLVIPDRSSYWEPSALFLISVVTGERRRLTSPPSHIYGDSSPAFSPDGRTLVFIRTEALMASDILSLELSSKLTPTGEPRRLSSGHHWTDSPAWMADRGWLVLSSDRNGSPSLWKMHVSGSQPRLVPVGENGYSPAISIQARRMVYVRASSDTNIWRLDLSRGKDGLGAAVSLIASTLDDETPDYSPDGRKIAFASSRSGTWEIWSSNSDGSHPSQLTSFGGPLTYAPRWSPEGKRISFVSNASGRPAICVIASAGGVPQVLTTRDSADAMPGSWSRDGKWIYYTSEDYQVWRVPSNGGTPVQLTIHGGAGAVESPDGQSLYYTKDETLWRVPVAGGQETEVLRPVLYSNFAVTSAAIYFIAPPESGRNSLRVYRFATAKTSRIAQFDKPIQLGLAVSPDEKSILYTQMDQQGANLMLVESFR